jgi:hypothetical protein
MPRTLKGFVISWVVWVIIVDCAVVGMYLVARKVPTISDAEWYLAQNSIVGLVVISLVWIFCRSLGRVLGTCIGLGIGALIPIAPAWIWGRWIESHASPSGVPLNGLDLWIGGLELMIPSALGAAIAGYLVSRKIEPLPQEQA